MVLKPEPIFAAVEELRTPESRVILMTPQGGRFDQVRAGRLAALPHLVIVCGITKAWITRWRNTSSMGDFHWRLCPDQRRPRSGGPGGRGGAASSRRSRRRTVGPGRLLLQRRPGRAAVYAPGRVGGWGRSPDVSPLRRSCPHRPVARGTGPGTHPPEPAGHAGIGLWEL